MSNIRLHIMPQHGYNKYNILTDEQYRDYTIERFKKKISKTDDDNECWIWNGTIMTGGVAGIKMRGEMKPAYRVMYEYHNNCKIKEGMYILHSCDNRRCMNPKHLREGTPAENSKDMTDRNRQAKGEKHGGAKLTHHQVQEIRIKWDLFNNQTTRGLANEYGVKQSCIRQIINYKNWI